ncbi:MAG TPA: hypothetical protein VJ302_10910, partial [Blastocatellia bacterium]|nr:hypothetical protein [Blastocatellia bacterium]
MKNYDEFEDKQKELEKEAEHKHETLGIVINWAFLIVGVLITGAATHFLTSKGMSNAPAYQNTIGADAGAWLTVLILEGSLLGLLIGQQTFLKERDQRSIATAAQYVIWVILALNTLCAFLIWTNGWAKLPLAMQKYTTWAFPVLICGAVLLWKEIWSRRRHGKQRMLALETSAKVNEIWREQYRENTDRYQRAVKEVSGSEEIRQMRLALAREDVITDL